MRSIAFDAAMAAYAARRRAIRTILSRGERPVALRGRLGDRPIDLLVHRDTAAHRVGKWRLTRFEAGEPIGHTESRSYESAIRDAVCEWMADLATLREGGQIG